jgi:glycerate dehydrogenase
MKIVVLDSHTTDHGSLSWDALSAFGRLEVYPRTTAIELLERARDADAVLTNKVPMSAPTIAALPCLRYVGILATGTNSVDLVACRERGIAVTNVPGYSTESVAQLVFALLLHFTHDVAGHDAKVKAGAWAASPDFTFSIQPLVELSGKTLAVVGLGAIGRAVASIGRAFGMNVLAAHAPGSSSTERIALEQALPVSDVVTLHCPLTSLTRGLVSADFLGRMKASAVLINTGRGGLIDERELLRALDEGRLGGVGLDVLEREPPAEGHPLLDPKAPWASKVVVTPHLGWATVEARQRLITAAVENLAAFVQGGQKNRVERRPDAE